MTPSSDPSGTFAGAGADAGAGVRVDRDAIVADAGSVLPELCIKCGAREEPKGFERVRHVYGDASIDFALCKRCASRWRSAMGQRKLLFLAAGLVPVWTFGAMATMGKSLPMGVLVFMCVVPVGFIAFHASRLRRQFGAWGKRTADGKVALHGAHPAALSSLASQASLARK